MNILFINPPLRLHQAAYMRPFGMASMGQMLLDAGHEVQIYDINLDRDEREEVPDKLPREKFDLIGAGGLITTYDYLLFLVPELRKIYNEVPIVIGGGGITSAPEVFMEHLRPDYGVIGEGEYTILELASGKDHRDILGLAYYEDEHLVFNLPRPLEKDIDKFPVWGSLDLLDVDRYARRTKHNKKANRELAIIATRGCPRNCYFCYHVFDRSMRYRSVDHVLAEIAMLIGRYGVRSFNISDELFTANKRYINEFCTKLIDNHFNIEWSCFSRVDTFTEEMAKLMKRAGCFRVGFGIESGSQRLLDEMNKGVTVEQAAEAYRTACDHFSNVGCTFIYGFPSEDRETMSETIEWCGELGIYSMFYHLNLYPKTKFYEDYKHKIIEKYGSEHEYFKKLGDASEFMLNITQMSDDDYFRYKYLMERELFVNSLKIAQVKLDPGSNVPQKYVRDGCIFILNPRNIRAKKKSYKMPIRDRHYMKVEEKEN